MKRLTLGDLMRALTVAHDPTREREPLPPYNPLATGCVADGCLAAFDAPPTVVIGDVLTCPACGSRTQVIDLGRDPERIEYIRARSMSTSMADEDDCIPGYLDPSEEL